MKQYVGFLLVAFFLIMSAVVFAGELVYRDGQGGQGCSVVSNGSNLNMTKTLTCGGAVISKYKKICSIRGGCSYEYEPISTLHDFNYDLPGFDSDEKEFGSVSRKSGANVFAARQNTKYYLAYSNDGILDKPVILVEGYDPANEIFPNFYFYRDFSSLIFDARDLIIVNFPDGAKDMDANALVLQQIITEINSSKTGSHPLAVIGYSMGGIIARKTLKNMEVQGLNHDTSIYVSYDSPHMGANSPSALAETVEALIDKLDSNTAGYTSSSLKRARKVYYSDAARQMLIGGDYFRPAVTTDFPDKLARIAITSGSLLGVNGMQSNSVVENQHIAGFKFYLWYSSGGALLPSSSLSKSFNWYTDRINNIYYDNVPGSYENIFRESYLKLQDGADKFESWLEPQDSNITFVPTFSSLAMNKAPTAELIDDFKYDSPFDRYIAVNPLGGVDSCFAFESQIAVGANIPHNPGDSYFNGDQLGQLRCAITQYHKPNAGVPNRFLKMGRGLASALIMIPANNLLLN